MQCSRDLFLLMRHVAAKARLHGQLQWHLRACIVVVDVPGPRPPAEQNSGHRWWLGSAARNTSTSWRIRITGACAVRTTGMSPASRS
jgi:hypothetical protein